MLICINHEIIIVSQYLDTLTPSAVMYVEIVIKPAEEVQGVKMWQLLPRFL